MVKSSPRRGFTIVEVTLFLALSGALMVGLIAGTTISISRQRYNDSVVTFSEALRAAYSDVVNVQNEPMQGRSDRAVYGRLLVVVGGNSAVDDAGKIYSYSILGNAVSSSQITESDAKAALLNLNPVLSASEVSSASNVTLPWGASVEDADGNSKMSYILIIRSPMTGIVHTYVVNDATGVATCDADAATCSAVLGDIITASRVEDIDFCIDSEDNSYSNRRDIRIQSGAGNSSGVYMVELDGTDSRCTGRP